MIDLALVHGAPAAPRGFVSRATRWMGLAFLAAGVLFGSVAYAANADLLVTVTPLPSLRDANGEVISSEVSVTSPDYTAYIAYQITVQNRTTNTINQANFSSPIQVLDSNGDVTTYTLTRYSNTLSNASCPVGGSVTDTNISCSIGQMPGNTQISFLAVFKTSVGGSSISLPWTFSYSNGNSINTPTSGNTFGGTTATNLIAQTPAQIASGFATYLTADSPTTLVTGANKGTAKSDFAYNKLTAKVDITGVTGLTTVSLTLSQAAGGLSNDTLTNNTTDLSIPPPKNSSNTPLLFNAPATIELRRDSSTIRNFNGINRAPLYYDAAADEPWQPPSANWPIPMCSDVPVDSDGLSAPNKVAAICIQDRVPLSKKNATGENIGDWLFILKALQNGISRW